MLWGKTALLAYPGTPSAVYTLGNAFHASARCDLCLFCARDIAALVFPRSVTRCQGKKTLPVNRSSCP